MPELHLRPVPPRLIDRQRLRILREIERKLLWLACWTVHHANHIRPSRDGLKVGGHQASCASVATIVTSLFFDVLRPGDRIAVKPHAAPIYHAAMYLLDREPVEQLVNFRALGGAQAYPSRSKDICGVDFSTGSVGLGAAMTLFASLTQDMVRMRGLAADGTSEGRMIAIVGDAELDEGNVYEALLEGWKYDVRNLWWVIDYNRQSLDRVVPERLFEKIQRFFETVGWKVITVKYGKKLEAAFAEPGGEALREWIDACPNDLYAALTFKGGAAWRAHLESDLGFNPAVRRILDTHDDEALAALMTNLGGHDLEAMLEAFHAVDNDLPHCFIAYTVKGWGLPFAGHKDNHAGLMTPQQMAEFQRRNRIPPGEEWSKTAGLEISAEELERFLSQVPYRRRVERHAAPIVEVPEKLALARRAAETSTQEAFGRIMGELAKSDLPLAHHIVTTSPDVTVSTGLAPWVSRRDVFNRKEHEDVFRTENVTSPTRWRESRQGQHLELGIAENNLFLALAALGLADELFGARILPIGTVYDPFVARGLDAFTYALYQNARFILVATPSGITLAPEGGAHQSIVSPLIGMGLPNLEYFEPAFADELAVILRYAFAHIQAKDGSSIYLRLSTRPLRQPEREMTPELAARILEGGYWLEPPAEGAELALICCGAPVAEAREALRQVREDVPAAGLLLVTSPDRLLTSWRQQQQASPIAHLLAPLAPHAALITVMDGPPATLAWIGAVRGQRVWTLGVDRFGQSGDIPDLYRLHRIDADAILDACAAALLAQGARGR